MNSLPDALDDYGRPALAEWMKDHPMLGIIMEAARRWANVHPSRLHEWHILHIKPASWGLTHPLDCDLTNCAYQTQAESWGERPDELGDYQWEGDPVEDDWSLVTSPGDK